MATNYSIRLCVKAGTEIASYGREEFESTMKEIIDDLRYHWELNVVASEIEEFEEDE